MNNKNLIICDSEETYAQALAMYLSQKKELMLQVRVCSSKEKLAELIEEGDDGLLLLSEEYAQQGSVSGNQEPHQDSVSGNQELYQGSVPDVQEPHQDSASDKNRNRRVCVLSSRIAKKNRADCPQIYKYQSGEKILAQLFEECPDWFDADSLVCKAAKEAKKRIIGVFSPVHRTGKTAYALRLGEDLAQTENVLYLSLEFFAGIDGHFRKSSQTIADVIYFSRQEKGNLGTFLASMVCHKGNLDYIAPAQVSEEMKEIRGEEWIRLAERILEQSIYETLILDIDDGVLGLYQLLEICTEIHMPVRNEPFAKAKLKQFESEVIMLGKEHIMQKVIRKEIQGGRR